MLVDHVEMTLGRRQNKGVLNLPDGLKGLATIAYHGCAIQILGLGYACIPRSIPSDHSS
jgi:hypothetical protein